MEEITVEDILKYAETAEKPNFTQLQLALQALKATPQEYTLLRLIMEKKFNLPSLDKIIKK
jgi:DNA-binding response OmpR family regulator